MKIITVVGARPQFIKAAAISRVIREQYAGEINEIIVHTGQHFDANMSDVFFEELDIPRPQYNLEISGGQHGEMTGRMLTAIEQVLLKEKPDWVLVYGDTNSTLAGALAAAKLHIPVAHVEAGLRSFNMRMPEEINRILTDKISTLLFCPTQAAVNNLQAEGVTKGVHNVGDVMYDVALYYADKAKTQSKILSHLGVKEKEFLLATCHRAENTDDPKKLTAILEALSELANQRPVIFPLHPRTKKLIADYGISHYLNDLKVIDPVPFLDMIALEQAAKVILTDSGGVQKEAYFYGVPCITLRDETEWVETVEMGANILTGSDKKKVNMAYHQHISDGKSVIATEVYGNGASATNILRKMKGSK